MVGLLGCWGSSCENADQELTENETVVEGGLNKFAVGLEAFLESPLQMLGGISPGGTGRKEQGIATDTAIFFAGKVRGL